MVVFKVSVIFVSLIFLWTFTKGDIQVSCVFMKSCILPCSFKVGDDAVIHWIQVTGEHPVHSYYYNQDRLAHQDKHFTGRTSLFKDLISRGNASLQLTGVKVQDQGRYKCYTSTFTGNKESFINLEVDAPVDQVDLVQEGKRITCSSTGIYPHPEVIWATDPPTKLILQEQPSVQQSEEKLYSISSFLIQSDNDTELNYICNIRTRSSSRRTTLFKLNSVTEKHTETTITCSALFTNFEGLIWRFNDSQIILNQTRADASPAISNGWRQHVKGVSESGSLMLKDLTPHHEGIYTCEASDAEETVITNTFLRIQQGPDDIRIIAATIGTIGLILLLVCLGLYWKKKKGQKGKEKRESNTEENKFQMKSKEETGENSHQKLLHKKP